MRSSVVIALVAASISLAGCTAYEIDRPGTWQATGANEHNLRAMIVNPQDLTTGSGAITTRGDSASRAVTRLANDRRRQLLNASVSRVGSSDSQSDSSSPGPAPGSSASGSSTQ
jgi:hypothetical protein